MEQVFIVLAVLVFWIFRGVAGAQRRVPGQDPYESDPLSPDGPRDVVSATRHQTLEAQQRAIEALQRWEEKQGLSAEKAGPAGPGGDPAGVPAASRTRVGRPAAISVSGANRQRREAFADIARMLDPEQSADRSPRGKHRFEVDVPAEPVPSAPVPSTPTPSTPAPRASPGATEKIPTRVPARDPESGAMRQSLDARKSEPAAGARRAAALSSLARIEALPLAARAIVYAEILGPPRSLS